MVKGQSFGDLELIVVDDGSTDDTWWILQELAKTDTRIKIDQRPANRPKGPSACRNIGVEKVKGQYIAFLDADDEWLINRLQHAFTYIQETGSKAMYSGAWIIDQKGKYFRESRSVRENESLFDFSINGDSFAPTPTLIMKADIAKQVGYPENIHIHEDFAYFIEAGRYISWSYLAIQDVLVHWEHNHLKKVDYGDCLWFYEKYQHTSKNKESRIKYLRYMFVDSVLKNSDPAFIEKYKKFLLDDGYKFNLFERALTFTPNLCRLVFLLKHLIKNKNSFNYRKIERINSHLL